MEQFTFENDIKHLFSRNKKCIVNADLDGILAGMFLQQFLDWEVVGYSSCGGTKNDELWLGDAGENLHECVFVDLPVYVNQLSVIDQHFVAVDESSINDYCTNGNKINPNILRHKVLCDNNRVNHYTEKYPFGTVHFVLACLEHLGVIGNNHVINWSEQISNFDLADLICRADRVISNTKCYNTNCVDWGKWLKSIGGINTNNLFDIVLNQYNERIQSENNVEQKLLSLGCTGKDGDCSGLFRKRDCSTLKEYFNFLSKCFNMKAMPVFEFEDFAQLDGERITFNNNNLSFIRNYVQQSNIFSYAFVSMRVLSITYIREKNK